MADVTPRTIGEALYWSYANFAMAIASCRHNERTYQQIDYIVRNKLYRGLLRGNLNLGSFLKDEKFKIASSGACCYCGSESDLTLDHLIPQLKGGKHSADNLVVACRSCNSSKKALDLLEWTAKNGEWPHFGLLRRYLKLAIHYCVEHGLMDRLLPSDVVADSGQATLYDALEPERQSDFGHKQSPSLPFAIALLPYRFPDPVDLKADFLPPPDDFEDNANGDAWEGPFSSENDA